MTMVAKRTVLRLYELLEQVCLLFGCSRQSQSRNCQYALIIPFVCWIFSFLRDEMSWLLYHDCVFHASSRNDVKRFCHCMNLSIGSEEVFILLLFIYLYVLVYVNQDKVGALQLVLSGADMVSMSGTDSSRQVYRQRALAILQQTIEDAFRGKRQFLSGN